jgi:hypothetical protein
LVWGKELYFASTKVEANASVDSLIPRFAVQAHLERLFEDEEAPETEEPGAIRSPTTTSAAALEALPTANDEELRAKNAAQRDWISRNGAQDRSFKGQRPRTSDSRASKTDPDATPMTWFKGGTSLGYQAHYVVDGGKARIILGVLVTPSEVTENRPMLDLRCGGHGSGGACAYVRSLVTPSTAPPRTSRPLRGKASERIWRCTNPGASHTSSKETTVVAQCGMTSAL